jgi:Membrane-associated phospholipid phosphatase
MNYLLIFGAKYLWIVSVGVFVFVFLSTDRRKFIKISILALPISYALGLLARMLYDNPRPFVVDGVTPLIEHVADNGFPSDHTLLVSSLAAICTIYNKKVGLIMWTITLVVAVSRVKVGVHHLLDVSASILISIASVWMIYFLNNQQNNEPRTTEQEQ